MSEHWLLSVQTIDRPFVLTSFTFWVGSHFGPHTIEVKPFFEHWYSRLCLHSWIVYTFSHLVVCSLSLCLLFTVVHSFRLAQHSSISHSLVQSIMLFGSSWSWITRLTSNGWTCRRYTKLLSRSINTSLFQEINRRKVLSQVLPLFDIDEWVE